MKQAYFWFIIAFVLMVAIAPTPGMMPKTQVAQAQTAPQVLRVAEVPNFEDVKFPEVLGVGSRVYVAGGSDKSNRKAVYTTSDPPYSGFSDRVPLGGSVSGGSDYSVVVMAVALDGTVYYLWESPDDKFFKIKRKDPNSTTWSDERTVISGGNFRVRPDIGVTSTGRIFVVWDENSRYRYRYSDNRGDNWSGTEIVSNDSSAGRPFLAPDSQGSMWLTYGTSGTSGAGRIKAGQFVSNGSSFSIRDVTPDKTDANYFADPTITVLPNNIPVVAWRDVNGTGIYYAERDPASGNWNRSRLVGRGSAYGTVGITSDRDGNIYMGWAGDPSGKMDFWYAYKPFGQNWQGPIQLTDNGDLEANVSISYTTFDYGYAHMVGERFTGRGLRTQYAVIKNAAVGCVIDSVKIDSDAQYSTDTELQISITPNATCAPTQMQISLNVPITETQPGRIPYSANPTISIPAQYAQQCVQTVYVSLYKDANARFASTMMKSDTIVYDAPGDVDAFVSVRNPHLGNRNPSYTPFQGLMDAPGSIRASNGDPAWTGTFQYYLSINDAQDCSKLKQFVVGNATISMPTASFSGVLGLPYPSSTAPGPKPFDVIVYDGLNSSKTYSQLINFDPIDDPSNTQADESGRPVVNSVNLSGDNANASARKSIIRTLSFSDTNVTDNLYRPNNPGTQFWGVWVANGPRNVANPDPATLSWFPVQVAQPATDFSIKWNVFNGSPGLNLDQDGSYTVFVRFLDGAGNPSTSIVSTTLQLDPGYSFPTIHMPVISKP